MVPLDRRHDWDQVRAYAADLAGEMAAAVPERYVAEAAKAKRTGRIFLDYLRNTRGATAICPYSTRARRARRWPRRCAGTSSVRRWPPTATTPARWSRGWPG